MPKHYLTYSGNNLVNVRLPDSSEVLYPPPPRPGLAKRAIPQALRDAFEKPVDMPPLGELVNGNSRILIAFDDNCQPFPPTSRPEIRQLMIETLLPMLYEAGVDKKNIHLICAVALHRKMKRHELEFMVGQWMTVHEVPSKDGAATTFHGEASIERALGGTYLRHDWHAKLEGRGDIVMMLMMNWSPEKDAFNCCMFDKFAESPDCSMVIG